MYKDKKKQKEANRLAQQKRRHTSVIPTNSLNVSHPKEDVIPLSHPVNKTSTLLDPEGILPDKLFKQVLSVSFYKEETEQEAMDRLDRARGYHIWNEARKKEQRLCLNPPEPMPI